MNGIPLQNSSMNGCHCKTDIMYKVPQLTKYALPTAWTEKQWLISSNVLIPTVLQYGPTFTNFCKDAHDISPTLHNLFAYSLYQGHQATITIQPNTSRQNYTAFSQPNNNLDGPRYTTATCHHNGLQHATTIIQQSKGPTIIQQALSWFGQQYSRHGQSKTNTSTPDNNLSDCMQLQATVCQIFHDVNKDLTMVNMLSSTTPELILSKLTWHIHQWITNCHNHILNYRKAAKLQAKLKTCDIHSYFPRRAQQSQPSHTDKNLLCPP